MERKKFYESPTTEVVEVKVEGLVCTTSNPPIFLLAPDDYLNGGDPFAEI